MFGDSKKQKLKKKLKQKQREQQQRRLAIILEARKTHERNRKKAEETLSTAGYTKVNTIEEDNFGAAVATNVAKAIVMGGNALEKLKARRKSLNKSRNTHRARLNKARKKFKARQRS